MHKNVGESEKIVGKGYADIFRGVGSHVGKSELGEAFLTRDQHGVGNASSDVVFLDVIDDVKINTSPDAIFGDEITSIGKSSPDVVFSDSYRSIGNDFFRRFCASYS
ncbi:hypothetical protein E6C27_scaffold222G00210 [Cucumis melo var. makuwa]|uniref:Uncharacterized protein n=1 Tax=Cucumis melo var. makuwa TaxID=1194695 RepID=A0A5A7UKH4_CUCMM|nr:hypothetical protein E6C27_scaffold222G00210 [Cucumis melo var. makuwa]